ncbi:uncharacterized protein LOC123564179 [Mercenaria mercenaria]|uniref:uncharacterized protein LOC123564179 n=1 Tax=Mercenaria mercenaria TaxID=6596 RepID=UPI001E1DEC29|nr:uncharacterized protein LOC123564179 [Mercenaria mercenaria]
MAASMAIRHILHSCNKTLRCNVLNIQTIRKLDKSIIWKRNFTCGSVLWSDKHLEARELKKLMESLTDKFAEARELLGDARESHGTVYFSEDLEDAQTAVDETLTEYKQLLDQLSDQQRKEVISTLGLRMEELKAQQRAIEDELKDHH